VVFKCGSKSLHVWMSDSSSVVKTNAVVGLSTQIITIMALSYQSEVLKLPFTTDSILSVMDKS